MARNRRAKQTWHAGCEGMGIFFGNWNGARGRSRWGWRWWAGVQRRAIFRRLF